MRSDLHMDPQGRSVSAALARDKLFRLVQVFELACVRDDSLGRSVSSGRSGGIVRFKPLGSVGRAGPLRSFRLDLVNFTRLVGSG